MSDLVLKLGTFKAVSIPELRRNDDLSVTVVFGDAATISVNVERPFKIQRFVNMPAQVEN